jgi:hypothetical protein
METGRYLPFGIKMIIGFFAVLVIFWIVGQGDEVVAYDVVDSLGLQESPDRVDPVIVQVNRGIAFADVVIQLPCFVIAIIGLLRLRFLGAIAAWFAFAINLYLTTAAWAKQFFYVQAGIEAEPFALSLHVLFAFIFLFSGWASWYLFRNRKLFI